MSDDTSDSDNSSSSDSSSGSQDALSQQVPTENSRSTTDSVKKSGSSGGDGPDRQQVSGHIPHDMRSSGGNDGSSGDSGSDGGNGSDE